MPILVMCRNPACGELFDAPDTATGQEVRCPMCGTAQTLSASPETAAEKPPTAPSPAAPAGQASPGAPAVSASPPASAKDAPAAAHSGRTAFSAPPAALGKDEVDLEAIDLRMADEPAERPPPPAGRAAHPGPSAPAAPQPPPAPPGPAAPAPESPEDLLPVLPPPKSGARGGQGREEVSASATAQAAGKGAPPAGGFAEFGRARLDDLCRGAAPESLVQAELEDAIWTAAPTAESQADADAEGASAVSDSVLGQKPQVALLIILGLAGLGVGLAAGIKLFPEQYLLAAYLGAGVGWMAGFTFGILLVLGAEQAGGGKVRCPVCHTEYPAETDECRVCGSLSLGPAPDPLAIECLHAGSYALSNPSSLLPPVALGVVAQIVVSITLELLHTSSKQAEQWVPFLIGLSALAGYLVFSYWMAFLLSAAAQPPPRVNLPRKAPKAPRVGSLETLASGLWGLAAAAVYVAPLVTIPLLPVAMLMLSSPGKKQALNPLRCARAVWRHPKGFVVLWMFLMMWLAGGVLAGIVVKALYDLRLSFPQTEGFAGAMLNVSLSSLAAAAFGVVASVFGLAIFRCIGAFGRYSAGTLPPPSAGSRLG